MEHKKNKEVLGPDDFLKNTEKKSIEEWGAGGTPIVPDKSKRSKNSSNKKAIIIAIIALVLLFLIIATIFGIKKIKENSNQKTMATETSVSEVAFSIESDIIEIPMLEGKTIEEVQSFLSENNINFKVFEENSDTIEKGIVIFQSVEEGSRITENSLVYLTVSLGKAAEKTTVKVNYDSGANPKPSQNKPVVTEKETEIKADYAIISVSTSTLLPGESTKISVDIYPENAKNKNYMLISGNNLVVSVEENNTARAVSPGSTIIEVYSTDGRILGSVYITVKEPETKPVVTQEPVTTPATKAIETFAPPVTKIPPISTTQSKTTTAPIVHYKVSFNANGGTVSEASRYIQKNAVYGTLPSPKRNGFTFDGWYTEDDSKVSSTTKLVYNKDHTLIAKWIENETIGWVDSLPADVDSSSYFIQYRYRNKEYTTSNQSSLDGWTKYGEPKVSYSEWKSSGWSSWGTSAKSSSETETQKVEVETKTVYRYYYYACKSCGNRQPIWDTACVKCGKHVDNSVRDYYWTTISYKDSKSSKDKNFPTKRRTTSVKGSEVWFFSNGNLNDTKVETKDAAGPNIIIKKGYRTRTSTRTKTVTYNYWKWGSWITTESPVSASSTKQVQYKYQKK